MALIVNVNVGATATPLGHVPNLMITTNQHIVKHGIIFLTYTLHMIVGVILLMIQTCVHLRLYYNDIHKLRLKEPKEIKELRRQIGIWERTARSLSSYTKDADLVRETLWKKVKILNAKLKKKETEGVVSSETYKATLDELKQSVSNFVKTKPIRPDIQFLFAFATPFQYPIKNKRLLLKSGSVLIFVITLFFIQSVPQWHRLSLGWCALIGVIFLLIIAER